MNDLSVIVAQNTTAQRQALIKRLRAAGNAVVYEATPGALAIGSEIRSFPTIREARQYSLGRPGNIVVEGPAVRKL